VRRVALTAMADAHERAIATLRGCAINAAEAPESSELQEVIGGTDFALTPNYTLVTVQGSGDRGAAMVRALPRRQPMVGREPLRGARRQDRPRSPRAA